LRPCGRAASLLVFLCLYAAMAAPWAGCTRGPRARGGRGELEFRKYDLDPAASYTLTLWDYGFPYPGGSDGAASIDHAAYVDAALYAFKRRYPNVEVQVELLGFHEGRERLEQALEEGNPPDVAATWWESPTHLHDLQVPVEPFLEAGEKDLYHPVAWEAVSRDGRAWSWPRWICPILMVGESRRLADAGFDPGRIAREGWTLDDLRWLATRPDAAGRGLVVIDHDGAFFRQLMLSQGVAGLVDQEGRFLWGGEEFRRAVQLCVDIVSLKGFPEPVDAMHASAVPLFTSGGAAAAAGLGPALAYFLTTRGAGRPSDGGDGGDESDGGVSLAPLLLPLPGMEDPGGVPVIATCNLVVYRQEGPVDEGRIQAAMELARHLSRWNTHVPPVSFIGVPAFVDGAEAWFSRGLLTPADAATVHRVIEQAAGEGFVLYPSSGASPDERDIEESFVTPALAGFWKGSLSGVDLVQRFLRRGDDAAAR